jgi:pyruvate formate lyase activating enzyme
MSCQWCQNADISQVRFESAQIGRFGRDLPPETLVEMAEREGIASIAYTYNEPTVYLEYTYDTAVLAHERGIKNVYVSNGFMSSETMEVLTPYLDAINVDLKGFTEELYEEYTGARLAPIKRNITTFAQETDVWVEVTTLIIPELNDSDAELRAAAEWLAGVSPDIPWHLSAFHPQHRMRDRGRTPQQTLQRAHQIGKEAGLHFVYVGNVFDPDRSNTYCYNCGQLLIQRFGFNAKTLWDEAGVCPNCGTVNPGVW